MALNTEARWQRLSPYVSQSRAERHVQGLLNQFSGIPRSCHGGWLVTMETDPQVDLLVYSNRRWLTLCATALVKVDQTVSPEMRGGLVALPVAEDAYELILGQQVDLAFRADLPFLAAIGRSLVGRVEIAVHRLLSRNAV